MILSPDAVAPIQSITATSVMGWGGFCFSLIACGVLVWDRVVGKGRAVATLDNKIDGLCAQLEDMEGKLTVVDGLAQSVRDLVFEWRGLDGRNGYKSIIRENQKRLAAIERRNDRLDAIREEDERRSGGQRRRLIDRELDRLGDEE